MNTARLCASRPCPGLPKTDGIDDPGTAHFAGSRRSKRLLSPVCSSC